jgi:hypothetical protein
MKRGRRNFKAKCMLLQTEQIAAAKPAKIVFVENQKMRNTKRNGKRGEKERRKQQKSVG